MRLSIASLRQVVKSDLTIQFVPQELTSYGGLELLRRCLRRIDLDGRLRQTFAGLRSDYGSVRLALVLLALFYVGARRLEHLRYLSGDPLVRRFCGLARLPRPGAPATPLGKRGPKPAIGDAEVVTWIRKVLPAIPFCGEGYRKVWARLAHRGLAVSGKLVLRLMRAPGLLARPAGWARPMATRLMTARLSPCAPVRCGARTRCGFTLRRTAGAGSSR